MMINILKNDNKFTQLCFLGDIHGEFNIVKMKVKQFDLRNSVVFQVGDFGIGFNPKQEKEFVGRLNKFLRLRDCFLYVIRGNHDNPSVFDGTQQFSNIIFVPDWTILELNVNDKDERIFCFGGAISIDRVLREQEKLGWWPEEIANFNDDLVDDVTNITLIATHTSPEYAEPYMLTNIVYKFAANDKKLIDDLKKERREMTYMFTRIMENNVDTLRAHYYGHFHYSAVNEYKGIILKLLSIDELCSSS